MVRGVEFLLILSIFIQVNMGSIFGLNQNHTQDKNRMLSYLRGRMRLPTERATTDKVSAGKDSGSEGSWDLEILPGKKDKSEVLAYLRGMKSPHSKFRIYDVKSKETQKKSKHQYDSKNDIVSYKLTDSDQELTEMSEYPKSKFEGHDEADSHGHGDTCFWHGRRANARDEPDDKGKGSQQLDDIINTEEVGNQISSTWQCIQKKFWISYDKISRKICDTFSGR